MWNKRFDIIIERKANRRDAQTCKKVPKFSYTRPEFLQLKTDDEILVSADHQIRPIILPRDVSRLPWRSGYAECINAGKSSRNEDQAAFYQDVLVKSSSLSSTGSSIEDELPWTYFGVFDGHAGAAVAVAAASQLHHIIKAKLNQIADLLIALEFDSRYKDEDDDDECPEDEFSDCDSCPISPPLTGGVFPATSTRQQNNNNISSDNGDQSQSNISENGKSATLPPPRPNRVDIPNVIDLCRNDVTVDSLITGALESSFWEIDSLIGQDKMDYKMPGGCTAIVGVFILGKLYVCNAGDSRAIVYKNNQVIPMSFDFTPTSERERILRLGLQRPDFLGKEFTHLEFLRRPTRKDLGQQMLYRDAYMTGWSVKTITYDDLKFPLVWGEGKRSRVLATIGVTRGFGDHELRAQHGSVLIKPFLTPEPEVKILSLEDDEALKAEDVLVIGSDGLWDVTNNEEAAEIVKLSFNLFQDSEESRLKYRYMTAAQDLVIHSRGHTSNWNSVWKTKDDRIASLDDIAVFVVPLQHYKEEYLEWKRLRAEAVAMRRKNNRRQLAAQVVQVPPYAFDSDGVDGDELTGESTDGAQSKPPDEALLQEESLAQVDAKAAQPSE